MKYKCSLQGIRERKREGKTSCEREHERCATPRIFFAFLRPATQATVGKCKTLSVGYCRK